MTLLSRLIFFPKKKMQESSGRIVTSEFSLVVPVKNNPKGVNHYLDELLSILEPSEYPREVIVVDNNSYPAIKLCARHLNSALPIKLISCKKRGPASARNMGAKFASGKWLLFNDSDCVPTKSLLTEICSGG